MMKNFKITIILLCASAIIGCAKKQLAINGETGYQIVVPANPDSITMEAANELQLHLEKLAKPGLPIVTEELYTGDKGIFLGRTRYADGAAIDLEQLGRDGYLFKQEEQNFIVAGGHGKGLLYGVYDLLESFGFRRYADDCDLIPDTRELSFPGDRVFVPKISHREVYYTGAYKPDFYKWHKLSSRGDEWGWFVHSFFGLVPPDTHGEKHPEYYSLRDGKRLAGRGSQLCLSNPEVLRITVNNLREMMAKNPAMTYWSVSQEDNDNYCQCNACRKLNEKYGGDPDRHSGSIIYFVNEVAKKFPDKVISTLAYRYSRVPPEHIVPGGNVNIMLCSIESGRQRPIEATDPGFARDLEGWAKLTRNIILWDYTVQFSNLISPFPNLHTLKENIQLFVGNNVPMVFAQGDMYTGAGGDMTELKTYLLAKLLWNPDADAQAIMDDFLHHYYGAAGSYIARYIRMIHDTMLESGMKLIIYGGPINARETYLSGELLEEYKRLFDQAEEAVKAEPELLKRVQRARLPIMYAELEIATICEANNPRSIYFHHENGKAGVRPEIKALLQQFISRCEENGVVKLNENGAPPEVYLASFERIFRKTDEFDGAKPIKKIASATDPDIGKMESLSNGLFGSFVSPSFQEFYWAGFRGKHMELVLDLGEVTPVASVTIDFLRGKTLGDRTLLPEFVTYEASLDGKDFGKKVKVVNPNHPAELPSFGNKDFVHSFQGNMENVEARYIRVHAESILTCPPWHSRAGMPVMIYADEIMIK